MKPEQIDLINDYLTKIDQSLLDTVPADSPMGLFTGKMGIAVYYGHRYVVTKDEKLFEHFAHYLESISKELDLNNLSLTFCDGLSGIVWGLNYLEKLELIEGDAFFQDAQIKTVIRQFIDNEMKRNNWDYLHGAFGGYLALEPIQFKNALPFLQDSKLGSSTESYWSSFFYEDQINLSLSHGQISILYFLIKYYAVSKSEDTKLLIRNICNFYVNQMYDPATSDYLFNSFYNEKVKSRLAWCYGDITIGMMLLKASIVLEDEIIKQHAISILKHTTTRKTLDETMCLDAGICHGAAGLALIYHELNELIHDEAFVEAENFWIDQTLINLNSNNFMFYERHIDQWIINPYFLDGLAGTGITLSTLVNKTMNTPKWSDVLLLD